MSMYLIGDLQGCADAFDRLLRTVDFSPSRDRLVLLGDLVNRGPDSLGVLRRLIALEGAARCVLGNHDLHLLAVAQGVRKPHRSDTLSAVLEAPSRAALLEWLAHQPLALLERVGDRQLLMVHAGVLPSWSVDSTLALAAEAQAMLRSPMLSEFLPRMYGNTPARWSPELRGDDRLRCIINVLTRLRFCTADDTMEFDTKEGAASAPPGFLPWFDVPGRRTADAVVAFGHWSTLGWLARDDIWSLDTGCVWGGCLSAVRMDPAASQQPASRGIAHALVQVRCEQARKPGPG